MTQSKNIQLVQSESTENSTLMQRLRDRYGALALTRAAAEAAAAERQGDPAQAALWQGVVRDIRHNVLIAETVV